MDYDGKGSTEHSEKQKMEKELKCNDCESSTIREDNLKRYQKAIEITHKYDKQFTTVSPK